MSIDRKLFNLREHCHVNQNTEGDRFVGVKADSSNVMIYFPIGYQLPKQDDELRRDITNLFNVLALFTDKTDSNIEKEKFTVAKKVDFPIQAYLNIINYYLEHNGCYYTENENRYRVDKRGKTNWSKTVKTLTPVVQERSLLYLSQVVRVSTPDIRRLITRINKYCVYEAFEKIGWLYTTNTPERPDIEFDKNKFLSTIYTKLNSTNNDNDKTLFRSMIAMIEFIDNQSIDKQFYFGTDNFEVVWERLIDNVFGIQNKSDYFPHGLWTERFGKNKGKTASALEPDSIMIYGNKYYVLDAKYYRYGINPNGGINFLPQSSDINKQITYGRFVKENKTSFGALVFNAFIMPYNSANNDFQIDKIISNVAEATGDWVVNPNTFERVQGIVIDTSYLLKNFYGDHEYAKQLLIQEIERPFLNEKYSI